MVQAVLRLRAALSLQLVNRRFQCGHICSVGIIDRGQFFHDLRIIITISAILIRSIADRVRGISRKLNDRDPVFHAFILGFCCHIVNESIDGLLHCVLASVRFIVRLFPVEIVRHRAGLVEHKDNVTGLRCGARRDRAGRVRFQMHRIAAVGFRRNRLSQLQTIILRLTGIGKRRRARGAVRRRLRPRHHERKNRPHRRRRLRVLDRSCGLSHIRSRIRCRARAHEQAQAQEQGCTEDERENAFFHGFVLLSQGVGIGSICVLEVLASTAPTCFHTSLTSLAAYCSRFAVCTASAVT